MHTNFSTVLLNTALIVCLIWIIAIVASLIGLYRRTDIFTPVKFFWAAVIFFAPVAGLIIYLVYGPKKRV